MKKIKLLSIIVACSLFLVACGNKGSDKEDNNQGPTLESSKEEKEKEKKKDEKPVKRTDLRSKKTKYLSVNGKEVSYEQFFKYYDLYSGVLAMRERLGSNLADLMIRNIVIDKALADKNVKVTEQEINDEIDKFKKSIGSENDFKKYLNLLGISDEVFKENMANNVKTQKHRQLFEKETKISDDEIKQAYESQKDKYDYVNAKHILVENEEKAKEISKKLKDGEDFKKLSDEHSTDKAAKAKGGVLGKVTKDKFDKTFTEAAFKLKANEVSDPVKTKHGYHIIVVTETGVGLEKHKEDVKKALVNQKYENSINEIVKSSDVKLYDYDGKEIKNNN